MKVEMERKFRPRSEVCGKKRENGEEEDEDEMESEGMCKVKWEMSFYVYQVGQNELWARKEVSWPKLS